MYIYIHVLKVSGLGRYGGARGYQWARRWSNTPRSSAPAPAGNRRASRK